ncbi:MAG TPA: hypothetical protein VGG27_16520 [Magnetospirillaceae bacterium]
MTHQAAQIEVDGQLYERIGVADFDRDSLHTLPLSILPIKLPALRRARLVKTPRLEVAIELFSGGGTGTGLLDIGNVEREFNLPTTPVHPDVMMLRKLSQLPSFDVYSLRILLREYGIPVADESGLKLSGDRVAKLNSYMMTFTRPLVNAIFGNSDASISSFDDVLGILRNPDVKKVRENLSKIAQTLSLEIMEIPRFLEDFADISLSLSYYRQCLDSIMPAIDSYMAASKELKGNFQLKQDPGVIATMVGIEKVLNNLLANITGRFESFDRSTNDLWQNLSAERFRKVESLIKSYHTNIGGVLCALSVKMDAWSRLFPNPNTGGPMRRAEFIMTEMKQGIEKIKAIKNDAPMGAELR